jgi:hypothetical protein
MKAQANENVKVVCRMKMITHIKPNKYEKHPCYQFTKQTHSSFVSLFFRHIIAWPKL